APRPSQARPPDRASSVLTALIRTAGGRNVTGLTSAPSRTRVERAASHPSVVQASSCGSVGSVPGACWARCAGTHTVSRPPSSAARTIRSSGACPVPLGNRVMLRLTRTAASVQPSAGLDRDDRGHRVEAVDEAGALVGGERHGAGDRAVRNPVLDLDGELAHRDAERGECAADVEDALHAAGGHDLVTALEPGGPGL